MANKRGEVALEKKFKIFFKRGKKNGGGSRFAVILPSPEKKE
jgi:hypothetical protein